jgi:hypothetical protein
MFVVTGGMIYDTFINAPIRRNTANQTMTNPPTEAQVVPAASTVCVEVEQLPQYTRSVIDRGVNDWANGLG